MRLSLHLLTAAAWLCLAVAARPGVLPEPAGPVVLRISGDIANTNAGDVAEFDLAMLEALAVRTTTTRTPWFEGERSFSGPLVSAVMEAVGATGSTFRVVAINDYATDIPMTDVTEFPVIFATRINGDVLSVREKGPVFVIYPFDAAPDLYNELYFGRSVWQVTRLEVF